VQKSPGWGFCASPGRKGRSRDNSTEGKKIPIGGGEAWHEKEDPGVVAGKKGKGSATIRTSSRSEMERETDGGALPAVARFLEQTVTQKRGGCSAAMVEGQGV